MIITVIGILIGFILGNTIVLLYLCHKRLPVEINRMKGGLIQRPPNLTALENRVEMIALEMNRHYIKQQLDIDYKIGELIKVDGDTYKITHIAKDEKKGSADEIFINGIGEKQHED